MTTPAQVADAVTNARAKIAAGNGDYLDEVVVALADERDRANKIARAAQERADATLAICVYCGRRQARSDTAAVFAHWKECEKHPARADLQAALALLWSHSGQRTNCQDERENAPRPKACRFLSIEHGTCWECRKAALLAAHPDSQRTAEGAMSIAGKCCGCGYAGEDETPCHERDDGVHCECWWDGPDDEQPKSEDSDER